MKSIPRVGTTEQFTFTVEPKHTIEFAGDGMPAVLSTPNLIGLLERTARQSLLPHLEEGERSSGSRWRFVTSHPRQLAKPSRAPRG